jgi:hypothetical protein
MPQSAAFTYDDPMPYQAAIRGGEVEVSVTARGDFRGKLIKIDLHNLWMQSGWENLPRVIQATVSPKRTGIQFLAMRDSQCCSTRAWSWTRKLLRRYNPAQHIIFEVRAPVVGQRCH